MNQTDSTISKLNAIEILYRRGYQSEVIDRAMDKLIAMERYRAQQELNEVEKRLQEFEAPTGCRRKIFRPAFRKVRWEMPRIFSNGTLSMICAKQCGSACRILKLSRHESHQPLSE